MKNSTKYMIWSLITMAISFGSLFTMIYVFDIGTKDSEMNGFWEWFFLILFFVIPLFITFKIAGRVPVEHYKEQEGEVNV